MQTEAPQRKKFVRRPGLGMHLDARVVAELVRLGLSVQPGVSRVYQQKQERWMIAGKEGGGCVGEVGHYTGYAGVSPDGIAVSIPTQSFIPNSNQRKVVGRELVRAQIFRYSSSCTLLVTRHYLDDTADPLKPTLARRVLFQGLDGILAAGTKQPVFFDEAGEPFSFPKELLPLIQAVSKGCMAEKNKSAYCIPLAPIKLHPIPKPRSEAAPAIAGEPLPIAEAVVAPPVEPTIGTYTRRKRVAAKTVAPQPTVAPAEVAELVGV